MNAGPMSQSELAAAVAKSDRRRESAWSLRFRVITTLILLAIGTFIAVYFIVFGAGIFYILRFGEVASGTASENRYLFISVGFDPSAGAESADAKSRLELLRARFAPWYYVVSDDSFKKIRIARRDVLKPASAVRKLPAETP